MIRRLLLIVLAGAFVPAPGTAQSVETQAGQRDPGRLELTREELVRLRSELEAVAASDGYSSETREQAEANIESIAERLSVGDFRVGDRVIIDVQGEPNMPDTLMVQPGPGIEIPSMGRVSLAGVLRSELQSHLVREVSRYIQMPRIRSMSLIRLSIQGEVSAPGFYAVPADMLLGDVFMIAGGPTANSQIDRVRIERGQEILWESLELQSAFVEGRTLDQLNLRAGDEIVVPGPGGNWYFQAFQVVAGIVSVALLGQRVF